MAEKVVAATSDVRLGLRSFRWQTIAPLIVWAIIVLIPVPAGLKTHQWWYFAVFAAVISGLVFESMPYGAVGLVGLAFAVAMRYMDADMTRSVQWGLSGFTDTTTWLVIGAFMFALGYAKSGLGRRIALLFVKKLGGHTLGLGYAITFADLVLAPATASNTARSGGTIFPIISNIPGLYGSEPGPTARKIGSFVMWVAYAAMCVTSSMFLTAMAPNSLALGFVKTTTKTDINWAQWFMGFLPIGVILILLVPLLVYLIYPPEIKNSKEVPEWAGKELTKMGSLSYKEIVMGVLAILAVFLWITGSNKDIALPFLGSNFIHTSAVCLVVIALMLVTGVVKFEDITSYRGAWDVFLYFGSLLTLASGLNQIGFIKWVAAGATAPLKNLDPTMAMIALVALFFWIHYSFSSMTSHTSATLPVVLTIAAAVPGLPIVTFGYLCLYALGLMGVISPYASGPAPIYLGSGFIERKDFWRLGLIFGVIYFAALVLIGVPYLMNFKP